MDDIDLLRQEVQGLEKKLEQRFNEQSNLLSLQSKEAEQQIKLVEQRFKSELQTRNGWLIGTSALLIVLFVFTLAMLVMINKNINSQIAGQTMLITSTQEMLQRQINHNQDYIFNLQLKSNKEASEKITLNNNSN